MKKISLKFILLFVGATLTACSTNPLNQQHMTASHAPNHPGHMMEMNKEKSTSSDESMMTGEESIGKNMDKSMDVLDKTKLSRALDKPLGKSTERENANTGISYSVVPTKKLTLNGNPFCRKYSVTAVKGDNKREINGTACVGKDGNWKAIN